MWFAGTSWDERGYEVAPIHSDGRTAPSVRFEANETAQIVDFLRSLTSDGDGVTAVIESTNGLLDGPLLTSGVDVLRADPWLLPERQVAGSVPARILAQLASDDTDRLVPLDLESGTLKGRMTEYRTEIGRSADTERDLARAGRFWVRGEDTVRRVALTFDDGPSSPYTEHILDILHHYDVHATFFCVGLHAQAHPHILARIASEGHLLGNHTWSHPFLPDLTRDELRFQVNATNQAIRVVTGLEPTLVRPPYGSRTPEVLSWLADLGMTTVLWDNDSCDWSMPGPESITAKALSQARNGSIVLMHDGGGNREQTVTALPPILESLLEQGYELVPTNLLATSTGSHPLHGTNPGMNGRTR